MFMRTVRTKRGVVGPIFAVLGGVGVLLSSGAAAATDWSQALAMTVVTQDYRFKPRHLQLHVNVPYRVHLVNSGKETHEFNAAKLFKRAELGNPEVLNVDKTEVLLQPGEQKDLLLMPTKRGKYNLICPDHDFAGMKGDITVR
jgi:uncharacterized cupredoxin-like copper-binding protein